MIIDGGDLMEIDKQSFGKRVKEIRKNHGLTQNQLGKLMENDELKENSANKGVVSAWERGESIPNPYRLKIIADLGNISVNQLLYGTSREIGLNYIVKNYGSLSKEDTDFILNRIDQYQNNSEKDLSYEEIISIIKAAEIELWTSDKRKMINFKEYAKNNSDYIQGFIIEIHKLLREAESTSNSDNPRVNEKIIGILNNAIDNLKFLLEQFK